MCESGRGVPTITSKQRIQSVASPRSMTMLKWSCRISRWKCKHLPFNDQTHKTAPTLIGLTEHSSRQSPGLPSRALRYLYRR